MHIRALIAEAVGSFVVLTVLFGAWLVARPGGGDIWSVAVAAGLALTAVTYALGHVSGGHFNPAVTLGLVAGGQFELAHAPGFVVAQIVGAGLAAGFVYIIGQGAVQAGRSDAINFASISNVYSGQGAIALIAALLLEVVLTAVLLVVFMGATTQSSMAAFAPLAIGAVFACCYLVAIPVTNAGLNPARSTAAALFGGPGSLAQLWIFWIAPLAGAFVGGLLARYLFTDN